MFQSPATVAEITELISTETGHVIATLVFLDKHPATIAFSVGEVVLQEDFAVIIARTAVGSVKAVFAKLLLAKYTLERSFIGNNVAIAAS